MESIRSASRQSTIWRWYPSGDNNFGVLQLPSTSGVGNPLSSSSITGLGQRADA